MTKEKSMLVEYFVPITSKAEVNGEYTIEGVAISETTTSNGHVFEADELRMSAKSLIGVPLLKDHINTVDNIVGKVKGASFNEQMRNIPFKAIVEDNKMKALINKGLLGTVSVGAHVDPKDIVENDDGTITPHNIIFKELSLVAVPADPSATFGKALNQAYTTHKSQSTENQVDKIIERGDTQMSEEAKPEVSETEETTVEEPVEEAKEEEVEAEEEKSDAVEERLNTIEAKLDKLLEADVDETKEVEKEAEPVKEEVEEEADEEEEEIEEKYKIVEGHKSFSFERLSYN